MTYETLKIIAMEDNPNLSYLYQNNREIHEIIPKAYKRYYSNIGKIKIENLYFSFLGNFNRIAKEIHYAGDDIKFYLSYIDNYFDDLNSNLTVHNSEDIENLNAIIRICEIVMEESIEHNDMDCLFQSIIQLESKISKKNLIKNEL